MLDGPPRPWRSPTRRTSSTSRLKPEFTLVPAYANDVTWKAVIEGERFDLETLAELFNEGDPLVALEAAGEYSLESMTLQDSSGEIDLDAVSALLKRVNGIARTLDHGYQPVRTTGRHIGPDGKVNVVIMGAVGRGRMKVRGTVTVTVDGKPVVEAPTTPKSLRYMKLAGQDSNVADAIRVMGQPDQLDWYDLYKVWEIIRDAAGNQKEVVKRGWATDSDLNRLTASANHPGISGDQARHARMSGTPSAKSTMTVREGEALVRRLMARWIESHPSYLQLTRLLGVTVTVEFLASIIPGFRALRTPVAAGALWLLDIAILLISHHAHFHINHYDIVTANSLLPDWIGIVVLPIVLALSYLLGSVMMSLTCPVLRKIIDLYRSAMTQIAAPYRMSANSRGHDWHSRPWRMYIDRLARRSNPLSANAHSLLYDYAISTLTSVGAPGAAAMMFPASHLHDKLTHSAIQLSQVNPTQYQEYDRIQAEAEFRIAVVPPLILTSAIIPISLRWLLILGVAACCLVLLVQSVSLTRTANDVLASATRAGYLEIPEMKSLAAYLTDHSAAPGTVGAWIGAIIVGLDRRGFFEESGALIREATELDQEYDVSQLVSHLESTDPDLAEQYKREFYTNRRIEVGKFKGTGVE